MDRFKFRAWNGKQFWFEGEMNGYANYRTSMEKMGDGWKFIRNNRVVASCEHGHILEQCTGQRDAKTTLIYEGDIMKYPDHSLYFIIRYSNSRAAFELVEILDDGGTCVYGSMDDMSRRGYRVVGNIHENPELLQT